jgi:hypothetical protein
MKEEKSNVDDCGCEHHSKSGSHSHHLDGHCPTDAFVNNLVDSIKKEFEKESEGK